ncbi:right-handed parallel beta-helix repeat-containing protein [Haladaptatus salinisoli]|uniref:right-handed parallel beta-helix repeat-containing protein n=1 Tax=Haladaptatus salinisoli TaxID=2884876 RepID=UPI0026E51EE8|nr:right-handed parallel beta-helix repeat-containing protein [Haladaptatus salinisoli]
MDDSSSDSTTDRSTENAFFAGKPWHDAVAYGATGDGASDDAPALQSAVDAAADGGGTVYLPPGTYRVESPVTLRSGVRFRGEGMGATTLVADGDDYAALEGFGTADDPLTDLSVESMAIDCSALGDGETYSTGEKCIYFQNVKRCRIVAVYAYGAPATGIGTDFMVDSLVHGCIAERNGRLWSPGDIGANGIGIGAGRFSAETVTVSDCHAADNGNNGVMFEAQGPDEENVHAGFMTAVGCTARGNRIGFRDSADRAVKFLGCSTTENDEHGFVVSDKDDTSPPATEHRIADCHAVDNGEHGVAVLDGAGPVLDVADCQISGNDGCGVFVAEPVDGAVSVSDSAVFENARSGVRFENGGDHLRVAGCSAFRNGRGGDAAGIRLAGGAGTYRYATLSDNDCYDDRDEPTQRIGIDIEGEHEGTKVVGNTLAGNAEAALRFEGRPELLRDNVGYRTENGGREAVADGEEIRHGLADRPTAVTLQSESKTRAFPGEIDDETVEIRLVAPDDEPVESTETVHWEARIR